MTSILTVDGIPLKDSLRKAERGRRAKAFLLVAPLLLFVLISFVFPIFEMLFRSVDNPVVANNLPLTIEKLEKWDGTNLPDQETFSLVAKELLIARENSKVGKIAARLNFESGGMRSMINKTVRKVRKYKGNDYKKALIQFDKRWGKVVTWKVIKRIGQRYTGIQYLAALDLKVNADNTIGLQSEDRRIYVKIFLRTIWVSVLVTIFCLILAYPVSFLLATLPLRISNLLLIMVLLPFWTSLLVRTTSWIVLLQRNGVVNDILVALDIILKMAVSR